MFFKKMNILVMLVVIFIYMFACSGCMTVKGLASDIHEVSGTINRGLEPMAENRRQARLDRAAKLIIAEKESKD